MLDLAFPAPGNNIKIPMDFLEYIESSVSLWLSNEDRNCLLIALLVGVYTDLNLTA